MKLNKLLLISAFTTAVLSANDTLTQINKINFVSLQIKVLL
jgi:hypothetical protein